MNILLHYLNYLVGTLINHQFTIHKVTKMAILFKLIFLFLTIFINHIHGLASTTKEIDGKYYSFHTDEKNKHAASSECKKEGGKLYEPRNFESYKKIKGNVKEPATVFIHTPGMFLTYPEKAMKFFGEDVRLELTAKAELGLRYTWDVKHEVHELVEFNGNECNGEKQYRKDLCVDKIIQRESLENIGCTTPFGTDKSQICTNVSKARKALKIYDEGINMWKWNGSDLLTTECKIPCSIITFTNQDIQSQDVSMISTKQTRVEINFEELIKVTTDYQTYTALSLIAEIGGYVGLFLGVSVNQVIDLMDVLVLKIQQLHDLLRM